MKPGKKIMIAISLLIALGLIGTAIACVQYIPWTPITDVAITRPPNNTIVFAGANYVDFFACTTANDTDCHSEGDWHYEDDPVTHSWSGPAGDDGFTPPTGVNDIDWQAPFATGDAVITVTADDSPLYDEPPETNTITLKVQNIIYVDIDATGNDDGTTWANAFDTIQEGINAAASVAEANNIVEVNEGTYYEPIDFIGKAITVRSVNTCNPTATVIDAGSAARVVYFHNSEDSNSVLKGFTITGHGRNRGIECTGASPKIEKCVIEGNGDTRANGGGMYCVNSSSPTIISCVFYENDADNGGGMYCGNSSSPTIVNCLFYDNESVDGAGIYTDSSSAPSITNCTFFGNDGDPEEQSLGGGIYFDGSSVELINCIFWDNWANDAEEIYNSGGDIDVSYCCIRGGINGDYCGGDALDDEGNNTADDPDFAGGNDPDGNDNKWMTGDDGLVPTCSSCDVIDGGSNSAISGIDKDIKCDDRIINSTVDMGAYEYAG